MRNILKTIFMSLFFTQTMQIIPMTTSTTSSRYNPEPLTRTPAGADLAYATSGGEGDFLLLAIMIIAGVIVGIPYLIYKIAKFIGDTTTVNKIVKDIIEKFKDGTINEKIKTQLESIKTINKEELQKAIKEVLKDGIIDSFNQQGDDLIELYRAKKPKIEKMIDDFLTQYLENINSPESLEYFLKSYKEDLELTKQQETQIAEDVQKLKIEQEKLPTLKEVLNTNKEIANSKSGNISIYIETETIEVDGEPQVTEGSTYIKVELDGKRTIYYKQEKGSTSLNKVSEQSLSQNIQSKLNNSADSVFATIQDGKITTYLGEHEPSFYTKDLSPIRLNQEAQKLDLPDTETIERDIQAESPTSSDTPPSDQTNPTGDYPGSEPGERSSFEADSTYHTQYGELSLKSFAL